MSSLERISSFIQSYIKDDEGILGQIYEDAKKNNVPIIRRETKELLKTQLLLKKPKRILEIGTAVGYSSLFMSQYISVDSKITTLELDEERVRIATNNILKLDKQNVISVIQGDAAETLKKLPDNEYDFVFVDAAKGQYINYYEDVLRVSTEEALIISDNILQDGEILESHYVVEKRNRTIHDRMREYVYILCNDKRVESSILSVGDGMAITIKKGKDL